MGLKLRLLVRDTLYNAQAGCMLCHLQRRQLWIESKELWHSCKAKEFERPAKEDQRTTVTETSHLH